MNTVVFCLLQEAAPLAALDSDSDLVDSSGEEEEEANDNHTDNQQATDAVNPSAIELENLDPGVNNVTQDVESANAVQETVGDRGYHNEDCTSASLTDLLAIIAGILLWVADIGTDVYVAHKAYTKYGVDWGFELTSILICSIVIAYILNAVVYCDILWKRTGRKHILLLLLGPLGRYLKF